MFLVVPCLSSREDIYEKERPVGIQIFGANLESMLESVEIVEKSGPDIIDINFGCPVKKVVSKGAGAGILKDVDLMVSLTKAMVKHTNLPITVKTRLGWDHDSIKIMEVAERLQDVGCKAISIHGRTRAQMYKGVADWKPIADVKNNPRMHIPVFGNGDVDTPEKAVEMRDQYGLDGAMIGRASIGNPWFFCCSKVSQNNICKQFQTFVNSSNNALKQSQNTLTRTHTNTQKHIQTREECSLATNTRFLA